MPYKEKSKIKEYNRLYYRDHREEEKERRRKYYAANSEKVKAKAREVYSRKKADKIKKDRENGVWDF